MFFLIMSMVFQIMSILSLIMSMFFLIISIPVPPGGDDNLCDVQNHLFDEKVQYQLRSKRGKVLQIQPQISVPRNGKLEERII